MVGFKKALALSAATAIGGAAVAMLINSASDTPCTVTGTCSQISDAMKVLLVGTHLYAFLLIPAAMYVFYSKIDELQDKRARCPFVALLGLSFMMSRKVFPFFSVGVNLGFIALLNKYQTDAFLNPLFQSVDALCRHCCMHGYCQHWSALATVSTSGKHCYMISFCTRSCAHHHVQKLTI